MDKYLNRVVGLYPSLTDAHNARDLMVLSGVPARQVRVLGGGVAATRDDAKADSDDVLKDILCDGVIGTVVGAVGGGGLAIALAAADVSLFVSNTMMAALYLAGWGAGVGGFLGAMIGVERCRGGVSGLIDDALSQGKTVVVAHARTEVETLVARQVVARDLEPSHGRCDPQTSFAPG